MSKKSVFIVIAFALAAILIFQQYKIDSLEKQLSQAKVDWDVYETGYYAGYDMGFSDGRYEGYEEGYDEGYYAGEWNQIEYFDSYVGTDEFYNDYSLEP